MCHAEPLLSVSLWPIAPSLPEPVWVCSAAATFMLSNLPVPFSGI